jgi:hypothetical protein
MADNTGMRSSRRYAKTPRKYWTDDRLRELGRIWREQGVAAAHAAFPSFSRHVIEQRLYATGDCRCFEDVEREDKLNHIRRQVIKNGRMDSAGLLGIISERPSVPSSPRPRGRPPRANVAEDIAS